MPADAVELAPGICRILAPNPSMMTGPGTNTYVIGDAELAVIDPGPAIHAHVENIVRQTGDRIRWILVTHTHPDHSPAARTLAAKTGAELLGMPAPDGLYQDQTFAPDRRLSDGDSLETSEFTLEAIHTPGHASNHLCYRHAGLNWLFTGDHVIDGSTVVINPPDGNMLHYIESLHKCRRLDCDAIAPGHGDLIDDPARAIDWIIAHRLEREEKVRAAIHAHPGLTTRELVPHVYQDVDPQRYDLAERSLFAHVLKLEAEGTARRSDEKWHES